MTKDYEEITLNIDFIKHAFSQINNNKTPIRIFHNYFLKNIEISEKTIDIGSGKHSSYLDFLKKKNVKLFFADKFHKKDENFIEVDLEDDLKINDQTYDTVIMFNVLEHVENYEKLISEIYRILKPGGKFEIFVPFMHRYHEDPKDIFRPTHSYLNKCLEKINFKVNVNLIGVGPFAVVSEILLKYCKINFIKKFFILIFLILNKVTKIFSKDYNTYYLGVHCSCKKD